MSPNVQVRSSAWCGSWFSDLRSTIKSRRGDRRNTLVLVPHGVDRFSRLVYGFCGVGETHYAAICWSRIAFTTGWCVLGKTEYHFTMTSYLTPNAFHMAQPTRRPGLCRPLSELRAEPNIHANSCIPGASCCAYGECGSVG
jgi:hypothetical protein